MKMNNIEAFDVKKISEFQFGDPDAKFDDLLLACPQLIRGVNEFLSGKKNIVLGERGVGKSALFRLVSEGLCKFSTENSDKKKRSLIVPVDDDIDYIAISNVIERLFIDKARHPHGKYLFFWEIYIISRVVDKLIEEFGSDQEIKTLDEDFKEILGVPKDAKFRFSDLLTMYKLSTGVKFDQAGTVSPTVSIEPVKEVASKENQVTDHDISQFRQRVRKAIRARQLVVYVLVDKIDDFLVDLEYEEQKKSVQALLDCTQAYRLPELKLKIFLRLDLFKRLDFERGGYDKIIPQVVRLQWTTDDIYAFVAYRLWFNYKRLQIKTPPWGINPHELDMDPSIGEEIRDLLLDRTEGFFGRIKNKSKFIQIIAKVVLSKFTRKSHSERKTNSLDAFFIGWLHLYFHLKSRI